ncbi:MAG: Maf family protein [Solirubrobacterales bacterium]
MRSGSGSPSPSGERLILASASPRRRRMLERLGVEFAVVVPEVEELRVGEPGEVVLENARRKAHAGLEAAGAGEAATVLAVDTDVALDGRLLGKPPDDAGARERLEALSGRTHEVLSGVVALGTAIGGGVPVERSATALTEVTFERLDRRTIDLYVASGEWRDRAGGYAIQGLGSILIESIRGDFSNVVGLPVRTLIELLPPNLLLGRPNTGEP